MYEKSERGGPQEKNERRFPDTFSLHFSRSGTKALEKQRLSADVKRGSSNLLSFFSCCFFGMVQFYDIASRIYEWVMGDICSK